MKKLLISFTSRIEQPQKFVLISLLFILPFAVVIYYGYSDTEERINFVRKEKMGVEYIQALKSVLQNAQQDRGMSNAYLSGDASFEEKLKKIHRQMRNDIKVVDEIENKYGETLKTTEKWNKIKEKWQKFGDRELNMTPKESFDAHTEFIGGILSLIFHITNNSKLILDPYYDSYYMMDISMNRIPLLTEELGKIRGLAAGAIASGAITSHEKINLLKILYSIKPAIDAIDRGMQIIYREDPLLKASMESSFKDVVASTNEFLEILNSRVIAAEHADIKPEEYFSLATTAIDANFRLFDVMSLALDESLQTRIDKFTAERYYIGISLFIVFIFFFYVVMRIKNSLTAQLSAKESLIKSQRQLHSITSTVGEGILLIDKNGSLTFINPEAERLLGWSGDELLGKSALEIIKCRCHSYDLQAIRDCPVLSKVLLSGDYYRTDEIFFSRKDETVFPAQCICTSIKEDGEVASTIIAFQDITESKNRENELKLAVSFNEQVEQWLQSRVTIEECIANVSRMFVSSAEYVDLDHVLKIIGEAISVNRAYIFQFYENKKKMDDTYEWCKTGTKPMIDNLKNLDTSAFSWSMKKLEQGEDVIVSDVNALPPEADAEKENFLSQDIKSLIFVPIHSMAKELKGFVGFDDTERCRNWLKEDVRALRIIAEILGTYWHRMEMYEHIKSSLKEKEVLLKEIHHRVKNNLQIISSLFSLQSAHIKDKQQALDMLDDSQSRIRSIAIVHERLYKSKDLAKIDFAGYIKDLMDNIFRSYRVNYNAVTMAIKVEDIYFDVDTATPLGLIINELVLNSIKHAFPAERGGEIFVSLRHENGGYTLIVRDNGIGFPEGLDFHNTKSLGMQLVNTLTEQINGKIEMDNKNGTEFRITFGK